MDELYSYAEVFYKNTEEPGWNIALVSGNEIEVENKIKNKWKKYKIFPGNKSSGKIKDIYPINPDPQMTHLTSNWIWSSEINKWFFEEEEIPLQTKNFLIENVLNINIDFPEDQNDISELYELHQENLQENNDVVEIYAEILFETSKEEIEIPLQYSSVISERIKFFLDNIKKEKYSYLIIDEYYYLKILVWPINGKCRVVFQDYNGHELVEEPMRFEIDKNEFLSKFEELYNKLNSFYTNINNKVRSYKKT